jgi:hypothetical protein
MNNDNNDEGDKIDEDIVSGFLLVIVTVSDSMMRHVTFALSLWVHVYVRQELEISWYDTHTAPEEQ